MGFEAALPLLNGQQRVNESYIHINGMTCNSCVQSIEGRFRFILNYKDFLEFIFRLFKGMISTKEGVKGISVDLQKKEAYVEFVDDVNAEQIADMIEDMGFEAYVKTVNGKEFNLGKTKPSQPISTFVFVL